MTGGSVSKSPLSVRGPGPVSDTMLLGTNVSVLTKWHLTPSDGCSRVHKCDRQTDRPLYGNICRSRCNRFKRCRLIILIKTMFMVWCCHNTAVESSPGSFDERKTAPSGAHRPADCWSRVSSHRLQHVQAYYRLHPLLLFILTHLQCLHSSHGG